VPIAPGATLEGAVGDGEDYELLFASAEEPPGVCPATGTRVTVIGRVVEGRGAWLVGADGSRREISGAGWEHT
jgi:thiamine monophosphate kinase